MGIYKITNLVNGKLYVGSSVNLDKRIYEHFRTLNKNEHSNIHLQRAFNKYGKENFVSEILDYVSHKSELKYREQYWMDKYNWDMLYNIAPFAENTTGIPCSKETRKKIANSLKGKPRPTYVTAKINKTLQEKYGGQHNRKPVYQVDKNTDKILNRFDSIRLASKYANGSESSIVACCKGKAKTCAGYKWKYA